MQLLKIDENHQAFYLKNDEYVPIVDIQREDLVYLVELMVMQEAITLDECSVENDIPNQIAKTIYVQLYSVLQDLSSNKDLYLQQHKEELETLKREFGI